MSKIKFKKIDEHSLEISISKNAPLEIVEELTNSLLSKGLEEDARISTLCTRRFKVVKRSNAEDVADLLIKSLIKMSKQDDAMSPTERRRKMMAESQGVKYEPNKVVPKIEQGFTGSTSIPKTPGQSNIRTMNELQKPAPNILPKKAASEDVEKSSYGPIGTELYDQAVNAKRKMNNVGDIAGDAPNKNVKSYSTKPGQLSSKAQADMTARTQAKLNRKQPVKVFSQEEKDALALKMGLKKTWANHLPFPSAEEEIMNFAAIQKKSKDENQLSNQLADIMNQKSMLGQNRQPTSNEMITAGESMRIGMPASSIQKTHAEWGDSFNNWLAEASKPINQRFSSAEEEDQYWNSIGIQDRDDGKTGY